MPDTASIAEQLVVETHLRQLKSLDGLRRLLADLNYRVSDEPVSTVDWKTEPTKAAKDGGLRAIARHQDFVITHCHLQELRVSSEREIVTRLVRQYDHGLFVFSNLEESHWHLVNVKRDSRRHNRLVLRRIAIGPEEQLRTAIERISLLKVKEDSWLGLEVELKHEEAFDVEKVTDQFYWDYKGIFDHITNRLQHQVNLRTARAFAQQFMNRMMFLYFLQKKGWLDGRRDFVPWLWQKYQENPSTEDNFYKRYLDPLFFLGFTSPSDDLTLSVTKQQLYARQDIPEEIKQVFLRLPFLNGGLFSKIDGVDDQGLELLDSEFENLFENLLEHYNFTVSEATPLDVEVAVNPEMLGKVYENLVLEEERGQAGIFYTPRVELDFMCRRVLIEYLDEESIVDRPDLIRLVMNADTPEFVPDFPPERLREISRKLEEVTVVDPACGSGAFLVGMMQVLSGLHRLICERLGESYHDFQVKKRIIGENLFGVDIKDWAVRVAELRLWLSLIINASLDEVQEEPGRAILPNLTFRIQAGDSLVEEIAGRSLSLRGRYNQMDADVRRQVNRLVDRKMDYYYNRGEVMPFQDIRRLETEVFQVILNDEVGQIDRELRRLRAQEQEGFQQELDIVKAGGPARAGPTQISPEKARLRRHIEELERERAEIIAVRNSQDIERGKGPLLWDIEFAEVFQHKGGFDIVIGNPPYVRQEDIAPANLLPDEVTETIKTRYKEQLQRSIKTYWGPSTTLSTRADLYVYFYLHGLALLRAGGVFCFITSNSWLDVGYGVELQHLLLTHIEIKDVYDNQAKRTFALSNVNTIIVLFRRPRDGADVASHVVRFVAFKKPFEECLTADNLCLIEWADSIQRTDEFRVYPCAQADLWRVGVDAGGEERRAMDLGFGHGVYTGDKWGGKYLRAPDIFFAISEKGRGKLAPLAQLAEVRFGIKTGADQWFYLSDEDARRLGIEPEFLRPALTKPAVERILVTGQDADTNLLMVSGSKAVLKGTNVLKWIQVGETRPFKGRGRYKASIPALRPTCASRARWYELPQRHPSPILWIEVKKRRFFTILNEGLLLADRSFYDVIPHGGIEPEILCALLNATYLALFCELSGNAPGGSGAGVQMPVVEVKRLPVLNPSLLSDRDTIELREAFRGMASRELLPLYEDVHQADRQRLDGVIARLLGITDEEQMRLYHAVSEMVHARLEKSKSLTRS